MGEPAQAPRSVTVWRCPAPEPPVPSISTRIGFVVLLSSALLVLWLARRGADELHRFRSDDLKYALKEARLELKSSSEIKQIGILAILMKQDSQAQNRKEPR